MTPEAQAPTPVQQESTPVTVHPGGAVDFDAVVAATVAETAAKKAAAKKPEKKEAAEAKDGKEADDKGDGSREVPDRGAKADSVAAEAPSKPAPKAVKFRSGDKDLEVAEDATLETTVDGKKESVTLAELRNHYSGKVNWDRRYNKLAEAEKKFKGDMDYINQKVDGILTLAKEKPLAAFFELCRLNNKDPKTVVESWNGFTAEAERWAGMNEVERRAAMAELERDNLKAAQEAEQQSRQRKQVEDQHNAQVSHLKERYSITDADYEKAAELAPRWYPDGQIGPQHVVAVHRLQMAETVLKEVAPERLSDKADPSLRILFQAAFENPEFSADDLKDIAIKSFGRDDSARRLGRKVTSQTGKPQDTPSRSNDDAWSFDQLT